MSSTPNPALAAAGAGPTGATLPSPGHPGGFPQHTPRGSRIALFVTGLATGILLVLVGWTLAKGIAEFRVDAEESAARSAPLATPSVELPREWRGARKPYTFDHMFREK